MLCNLVRVRRKAQMDATLTCKQQRRSAAKLMYASADGRQTVPCRPNKKSFWQNPKSAKSRITSILLVNFRCLESNNHISASAQNESFVELGIFMMGPNEMR